MFSILILLLGNLKWLSFSAPGSHFDHNATQYSSWRGMWMDQSHSMQILQRSEDTGRFLLLQKKYSKSLSLAENLNLTANNLFKFSAQDNNLEYLFWGSKNLP